MDTVHPAGWYPDPSGMPDTFRWWDGVRWTQALSPRADAPPPPSPKPVVSEDPTSPTGHTGPAAGSTETADERSATGHGEATPDADPSEPSTAASGTDGEQDTTTTDQNGGSDADTGTKPNQDPDRTQPAAVPPPEGAPGPEYLPPAISSAGPRSGGASGTDHTGPEGSDDPERPDSGRQNLRSVVVLVTVLALIGGVAVAAWFWWPREDAEVATPPPHQTPSSTPPESSPSPTPEPNTPRPSETEDSQPSESARLVFDPIGKGWKENSRLGLLTNGYAETQVTQPDFDGRNDWIALVATGTAPPQTRQGGLKGQARAVSTWFRETSFDPMKVDVDQVDDESVRVDGRPAHLLVQRFRYDHPALRSRSDLVTVVVVDMGENNPPGVFVASVPNTDESLTVDVDNARRSLRIAE